MLYSCGTIKEGFTNQKKNSTDEFLVEKKSPLIMPPSYGELPVPSDEKTSKKYQTNNIRYFLSHHITNLKINGISIDKFMLKISNRISVYNSGKCKKYHGGPISQDIIFNSLKK